VNEFLRDYGVILGIILVIIAIAVAVALIQGPECLLVRCVEVK
jgi:hypothetical protein